MRILFAAHQFFPDHSAGVEVVTLNLARELQSRGHEPFVFAAKRSVPHGDIVPGDIEDYEFEDLPVRRVGRPQEGLSRPYRLNYENEVMAERAREYAQEIGPDVIHAMHLQGLSAGALPVFEETGAPVVFTAADFWTVCPVVDLYRHDGVLCRGPEVAHCIRCIASRNPDSRLKARVAPLPDAAIRAAGLLSRTPLPRFVGPLRQVGDVRERAGYIREKMECADRIIVYTRLARDLLLSNGVGAGKIEILPYGIDTTDIPVVPEREIPPLRVGFVGTLAPHKGCDLLIQAFRQSPDLEATLTIHGSSRGYEEYAEELSGLAKGDGRITFSGPFRREELGRVLSEMDVLAVPSRWYENAPGVIFEAFAAKLPVIAADLGGMSEFVKPEQNGLLFEREDARDLGHQLERLATEPGLIGRLRAGIGAVKTVREYAGELEELYNSLLESRR